MTAPAVPPTPPTNPPPAPSTSATPSSGPATGAQETGFRYTPGTGVPDFLIGKSAAEAAELVNQLYRQNQQLAAQAMRPPQAPGYVPPPTGYVPPPSYAPPAYGQPQWQAPTMPVSTQQVHKPTPQDFIERPAEATEQYAQWLEATRFNPQFQQAASQNAQLAREMVAMRRPEDFKKYGPEIDLTLQKVAPDPNSWTPENINYVVDMVRGRHVEDLLAEERSRHQNAIGGASARPDGGSAPGASPAGTNAIDLDKLPANYQAALRKLNLDQHSIDEFLVGAYVKTGMEKDLDAARQRWVTQASRGDIVTDGREYLSGIYS